MTALFCFLLWVPASFLPPTKREKGAGFVGFSLLVFPEAWGGVEQRITGTPVEL